jgi:hypothetical protein
MSNCAHQGSGASWGAYQSCMKKHEKPIEEEKLIRVPPDLAASLTCRNAVKAQQFVPFQESSGETRLYPTE